MIRAQIRNNQCDVNLTWLRASRDDLLAEPVNHGTGVSRYGVNTSHGTGDTAMVFPRKKSPNPKLPSNVCLPWQDLLGEEALGQKPGGDG